MREKIAIYGAGGHGRFVAWTILECNKVEDDYEIPFFIDDDQKLWGQNVNGIPVLDFESAVRKVENLIVVCSIGSPKIRQRIMEKVYSRDLRSISITNPSVQISPWVEIGEGSIIGAGSILSSNVRVGKHVHINFDCTIGHDAVIQDFATIGPGVHVAGNVHIGARAFVGVGAVIINGTAENPIVIGNDAVVGAAACVTKSVPAGHTVAGVPAKPIIT